VVLNPQDNPVSESERPQAKVVEVIKKLLAKTVEAGCTQAEAAHAFAKATELLTKYNLRLDDVRVREQVGGYEMFTEEPAIETGKWTIEMNMAYQIVHEFYFVEGIFLDREGRTRTLYLFGTETNVATARHIFTALLSTADRLWTIYKICKKRPSSDRRIFVVGLMKGFHDKLREEREALKMEQDLLKGTSGGTALAIRRIEDMTVEKYKEKYPKTKTARGNYADVQGDQGSLKAGYEAGRRLNLQRTITAASGGSRKAIE
jgi:hypothetical protein